MSLACISPRKMAYRAATLLILPLPLFLLSAYRPVAAGCSNVTEFSIQLDTLLAEYDRETLPGAPVLVEVAFQVRHANIYQSSSSIHVLADLIMSWKDKRLTWNSSEWGCESALVSAERLWLPDVEVVSAATRGPEEAQRARLTNEGQISWSSRLDLTAPLELRLEAWPRDLQTAEFKFASRDHETNQIDLKFSEVASTLGYTGGGWVLEGVSRSLRGWQRGGGERRLATWSVQLRRRAPAHSVAVASLLTAVTMLMIAAIVLPPASRPGLFACASFIAALWMVSALIRLPGSVSAPRSLASAGALCACGGAATLLAAVVVRLSSISSAPSARPVRACLNAATATATFFRIAPEGISGGERGAWVTAAKLLDYTAKICILIVLLVVICVNL